MLLFMNFIGLINLGIVLLYYFYTQSPVHEADPRKYTRKYTRKTHPGPEDSGECRASW